MPEPTSSSIGAVALATGAITITGSLLGMQNDALLAGLFGGLVSLMHLAPMTRLRMALSLATAAVFGAFLAPIAHAASLNYFPYLKTAGEGLRLASSFVLGMVAQIAIPALFKILQRKTESL